MITRRRVSYALLLVFVWALVAGVFCALGSSKALAGRNELVAARTDANGEGLRNGGVESHLDKAAADMRTAHSEFASPIVAPWRLLPVGGRQISSAIALTGAGAKVSQAGADALNEVSQLNTQAKTNRQQTLTQLAAIASQTDARINNTDFGPSQGLISPLAKARNEISTDTITIRQGLERAAAGANGAAALFNTNANYLLIAANNSEMRSGSGMFLSAGVLTTGNGIVSAGDMTSVGNYNVTAGQVTWPDQLNALWGFLKEKGNYQDLMLSPRFDQSAPLATQMWQTKTGQKVAGVMVVDPQFLKAILAATGPVTVNGQALTADNITHYLEFTQYEGMSATAAQNAQRRDALSDIANAAFNQLNKGTWDPITLAKQLAIAANGRHILLYSVDTNVNQDWLTAGVGGELDQNSLMLSLDNLGGNKLDQFIKTDATVVENVTLDGYDVSITTVVTNNAPTSGPQYVLGPFPNSSLKAGEYDGVLNFNLPGDATGITFDQQTTGLAAGPDGPTQAVAVQVDLLAGQSATYTIHFYRSKDADFTRVMPSARVPATTWHYRGTTWADDHQHFVLP